MAAVEHQPEVEDDHEIDNGPTDATVMSKYKTAGVITKKAMAAVVAACTPGRKAVELSMIGDETIVKECAAIYGKLKPADKGIAFPTCIGINNCCGHFSPMKDDETTLAEGDVVKIDMGAHIHGFMALEAHTVVVGKGPGNPATGRAADVVAAAYNAGQVILRLLRPGNTSDDVTKMVQRTIEQFGCNAVGGVMSHLVKRWSQDPEEAKIMLNSVREDAPKPTTYTFEENEVYVVDVVVSTGEGGVRELDKRTTVYRNKHNEYSLKMQASRAFFGEVVKNHPRMHFSIRDFDPKKTRLGISECMKHDMLEYFPVLFEREGELVAQFKMTVLLMPAGPLLLDVVDAPALQPDHSIQDEEIIELLKQPIRAPKKKKKKGGAAAGGSA